MISTSRARTLGAFILIAPAMPAQVHAQSLDAPVSITVSYTDLDLSHPAGAAVLLRRLRNAATEACGLEPDVRDLSRRMAFDHCRNEALGRAVADVDSPTLTALAAKSGVTIKLARR